MDIHIREQRLPGIGHRYELDIDAGQKLTVVTVTLGPGSPAIGRPVNEIRLMGDVEAAVLAVIRVKLPSWFDENTRPAQAGDRVVIAVRRQHLAMVVSQLAG